MNAPYAIGFLGAGQMATAMAKGWLDADLIDQQRSLGSCLSASSRQRFQTLTGLGTATNNDVIAKADIIVLGVKPQVLPGLLDEIRSQLGHQHLVLSIAAGVTLKQLAERLGSETRLVRVMPNTPCLIAASASAFALSMAAQPDDGEVVTALMNALGIAYKLPEHLLDAVTGLSGSGPAYGYVMIEALADGGVKMGLPRDIALSLAAQTLVGAGRMVLETGQHPGQLKDAVTSPGGTTIAALHALEQGRLRATLMNAVEASTHRAEELGKK